MFATPAASKPLVLALVLAVPPVATAADWLPASGTGTCSATDVDFSDTRHGFAAGAFNCGLVTDDGGLTWTPIRVVPQQGQSLMFAHAADADTFYAARQNLYRSTDRGKTWTELAALGAAGGGSVFDIHFADAAHWVAAKGGQIHVTDDGGDSWTLAYPGEFNINFDELHFPDPQIGYATGGIARSSGELGTVLRSDDAGASWTLLTFPHGKITAADFIDADHGIVATQSQGLFETVDGAQTWTHIAASPDVTPINDLVHRGTHWYASTSAGCVHESFDNARTWQESYCDPAERALAALSARGGAIVAAGNDGVAVFEERILRDDFEAPQAPRF